MLVTAVALFAAWPSPPYVDGLQTRPEGKSEGAAGATVASAPSMDAAPQIASYALEARLDARSHTISGQGTITLENHSRSELSEIYLHLYLNAFKNNQTLFLRSPFTRGRSGDPATDWGYCKIEELSQDGHDIWRDHVFETPNDETDVRVRLRSPVPPGATLVLNVRFTSQLPPIVERTGYSEDYHLAGQWFPKLAKLSPDGTWAHFPFHPQAEFYADYGNYAITLDVPSEFIVGATGQGTLLPSDDPHRKRIHFEARGVHDFAWTAWPDFHTREVEIDGIAVRVLFPRGHDDNVERTLAALRFGLPHFGERYGRYPYPTLTVVHPPRHARHSGGMEYPTFMTTGGAWYSGYFSRAVELVTLHELAHQWFQGMIGSDETRYPFLDEGLASHAETVAARTWLGAKSATDFLGFELSVGALHRVAASRVGGTQSPGLAADEFVSFQALASLVYSRTATLLATLEGVYGEEAVARALGRYARQQRFRHPDPSALLDALGSELGAGAREQVVKALFDRGDLDYAVAEIQVAKLPGPDGLFGQELAAPATFEDPPLTRHRSRIVVERRGTLQFPVTITATFDDGSRRDYRWEGSEETFEIVEDLATRVVSVMVDPSGNLPIDDNLLNNGRTREAPASGHSLERLVLLVEWLMRTLGP